MAKERSGNPSGDDSGDLHNLFPGSEPPPPPANAGEASKLAADGWPAWMGPATPPSAPVRPSAAANRPKPAAQNTKQRAAPAVAAQSPAAAASRPAQPPPPPAAPSPRRWLRSLACAFVVVLALIAGEMAARYRPETAIRFQHAVADARDRLPASLPPTKLWAVAGGVVLVLTGILVWQAGRPRRPLFLPLSLLLCLGSAAVGLFRGGHDLDLERNAALFKGRVGSLESELGGLRQKLAEGQTMTRLLEELKRQLQEQTARAQEAQADRDKMQKSSIVNQAALKERDEALSALKKEIEELRKKLAEKD
jgi:hypothetical protein